MTSQRAIHRAKYFSNAQNLTLNNDWGGCEDFATTRALVIELAMDEKILASQLGMTGKAKAYTPQKAVLSSQPTYLKDSIPLQRGYKTAALLGLLVSI